MKKYLVVVASLLIQQSFGQLNITSGTRVNIETGAYLVATGNVNSSTSFLGSGALVMKGTTLQQLKMNGVTIPNLQINNPANILLTSNARVSQRLNFDNGKIQTGIYRVYLESAAVVTGAGPGRFVETNGTGQLRKVVTSNVTNYSFPVGNGSNYTPVSVTSTGTYSSAEIGVNAKGMIHPDKPSGVPNYLNTYWTVIRMGITGTVSAVATYTASNVIGNEAILRGYFWNGSSWTTTGTSINTGTNQITVNVTGSGGDVYAMSTILAGARIADNSFTDENKTNTLSVKVFPNPTTGSAVLNLNISYDQPVSIAIIDGHGRITQFKNVRMHKGYNTYRLDLSSLRNGIYEVQVKSFNQSKTFKIIKY